MAKTSWPTLERGDTVAVVATGYAVREPDLRAGVARLERWGFRPRLGEHVLDRDGYLAGSDPARGRDLVDALTDDRVRAVWFARGGYGTARLLESIPPRALRSSPALWIGYSDLTALFAARMRHGGGACLYGPVVTELHEPAAYDGPGLRRALRGEFRDWGFRARQVVAPGKARGVLIGGNLSVWTHLCGTRHLPRGEGAILCLEDFGEPTYRIDRMLTQLKAARGLDRLAGVLLGGIDTTPRRHFPPDRSVDDVIRERFAPLGVPVVRGLPFGHRARKRVVPLGAQAVIDTAARRIRFST